MPERRKKPVLLILIHGIRTHADWQHELPGWIDADESIVVKAPGYGYFDAFRFWFPFLTRNGPINKISRELDDFLPNYPENEWDRIIIAHSFGTYTITKVLENRPAWKFSDIILCGSIVSKGFRWTGISNQLQEGGRIVNEVGTLDVWPAMANAWSWGYGPTGTYGMQSGQVDDRVHQIGHSDFFTEEFAKEYWKPFIHERRIARNDPVVLDKPRPWWFRALNLPLGSMSILFLLIIGLASFIYGVLPNPNPNQIKIEPVSFNGYYSEVPNVMGNGFLGKLLVKNNKDRPIGLSNIVFFDKNRDAIVVGGIGFVCVVLDSEVISAGGESIINCVSGWRESNYVFSLYNRIRDKVCFIRYEYYGFYSGKGDQNFRWVDEAEC